MWKAMRLGFRDGYSEPRRKFQPGDQYPGY
jgi:hypothetical protein